MRACCSKVSEQYAVGAAVGAAVGSKVLHWNARSMKYSYTVAVTWLLLYDCCYMVAVTWLLLHDHCYMAAVT